MTDYTIMDSGKAACYHCRGIGKECFTCGSLSEGACTCTAEGFAPVPCDLCNGTGMEAKVDIEFKANERGFLTAEFQDKYGKGCSLQASSIATEPCIWLGCDEGLHFHKTPEGTFGGKVIEDADRKEKCCARMHLSLQHVRALLPHLIRFVNEGSLR